jgi:hypothetical protein
VERLAEYAHAAGRDPAALRRLLLVGFTDDAWATSIDACAELLGRYREVGIDEFAFPFPVGGLDEDRFTRTVIGARDALAT